MMGPSREGSWPASLLCLGALRQPTPCGAAPEAPSANARACCRTVAGRRCTTACGIARAGGCRRRVGACCKGENSARKDPYPRVPLVPRASRAGARLVHAIMMQAGLEPSCHPASWRADAASGRQSCRGRRQLRGEARAVVIVPTTAPRGVCQRLTSGPRAPPDAGRLYEACDWRPGVSEGRGQGAQHRVSGHELQLLGAHCQSAAHGEDVRAPCQGSRDLGTRHVAASARMSLVGGVRATSAAATPRAPPPFRLAAAWRAHGGRALP